MSYSETFHCSVCGKVKGDVNHWWLASDEPTVACAVLYALGLNIQTIGITTSARFRVRAHKLLRINIWRES